MIAQLTTETINELSFDGPLEWKTVAGVGILIAVVILVILWLERQIIGKFWMAFFVMLRFSALAAACWMLLQPSLVERRSTVQTRSVAIIADRSGSMETVDNRLTPQMLPWIEPDNVATSSADRAAIDLRFAARLVRTHWLESAALSSQAEAKVLQQFDRAAERCETHLEKLIEQTKTSDPLVSDRATSILDELQISILDRRELVGQSGGVERGNINRFADRIVESLEQQAVDLDTVIRKLGHDRVQQEAEFAGRSRKELVTEWLERLETDTLSKLASKATIKRATFDSSVQSFSGADWKKRLAVASASVPTGGIANPAGGSRTDLTAAVGWYGPTAVTDRLAAVVLVSEGGHNADTKLSPVAAARSLGGVPVIGVGIGNAMRSRDMVLHQVDAPRIVTEDDDIKIEAIISAYDCDGETVEVTLNQGSREIDTRTVRVDSALSDTRLQFRVPAGKPGLREFQLAIEPVDREVSEKNNYSAFSVETIRGKTRVLIADYQTRWEYRYLQMLFARDPRVEADEFLDMPYPHRTGQVAALGRLPRSVEEWAHYDVVLLGDVLLDESTRTSLQDFVRTRGGRVVVVAGQNHMPGAYVDDPFFDMLPVRNRPGAIQPIEPYIALSQEGAMHPAMQIEATPQESRRRWWLASSRTSVGYVSPWMVPRDTARVLATLHGGDVELDDTIGAPPDSAAWLMWHRVGAGRVVYASAPSAYKLRFRGGDTYHHRFWGQLLRWLMSADVANDDQLVHLRTDKSNYIQGDTVQIVAQLRDQQGVPEGGGDVSVEIIPTTGESKTVPLKEDESLPGTYRSELRDIEPDVYQLKPTGRTVERLVAENPDLDLSPVLITIEQVGDIEHMMTSANYPLMSEIAAVSGGELVTPAAAEEVFALLPLEEEVKTVEERTPIWNRWPLLFLVAGCLSTEWIIRKLKGLV